MADYRVDGQGSSLLAPPAPRRSVGVASARITIDGDLSRLGLGESILQMRVGAASGNVLATLSAKSGPTVSLRPTSVRARARNPPQILGRATEIGAAAAALRGGRLIEFHGPDGIGKTTLLRHVANLPSLVTDPHSVVCLSARGLSRDDLLHTLFGIFYSVDVPTKPTPEALRRYLLPVRATVLLDDVTLTDGEVADLGDLAPHCSLLLVARQGHVLPAGHSLRLGGLSTTDARLLFASRLGRDITDDESASVDALIERAQGHPRTLVDHAVRARDAGGPLRDFLDSVQGPSVRGSSRQGPSVEGPSVQGPSVQGPSSQRAGNGAVSPRSRVAQRIVALLSLAPGIRLTVHQVSAALGIRNAGPVLESLVEDGLLEMSVAAAGTQTEPVYGVPGDRSPSTADLREDPRGRRELENALRRPGGRPVDPATIPHEHRQALTILLGLAGAERRWADVIRLGRLLDVSYALSGHWDGWLRVLESVHTAARESRSRWDEAWALHQMGTRAVCLGLDGEAQVLLAQAVQLRLALHDDVGAAVSRANLGLLRLSSGVLPPATSHEPGPPSAPAGPPAGWTGRLRRRVVLTVLAISVGILTTLAITRPWADTGSAAAAPPPPTPAISAIVRPAQLDFGRPRIGATAPTRTLVLTNRSGAPLPLGRAHLSGADVARFAIVRDNCHADLPPSSECAYTLRFTPAKAGASRAHLSVLAGRDLDVPLVGFATPAPVATVQVPQLAGRPRSAAQALLAKSGLRLGSVAVVRRDDRPSQSVLRADPAPGSAVVAGSRVNLVVSARAPVRDVPEVAGMTVGQAFRELARSGLERGRVHEEASDVVPVGRVLRSRPAAGRPTPVGAPVTLIVSSGVAPVVVPDLVGHARSEATAALRDLGLKVGTTSRKEASEAAGTVLSTDPAGGVEVAPGTRVKIVVATAARSVVVPPLSGRTATEARRILQAAGLIIGTVSEAVDGSVPAGTVVGSNPSVGSRVPNGSRISIVVSARPVGGVRVPDLSHRSEQAARAALAAVGLRPGAVSSAHDAAVPAGSVIRSDPPAGTVVKTDSLVSLVLSGGPDRVSVPPVTGLSLEAAEAALRAQHLRVRVVEQAPDASVPKGKDGPGIVLASAPGPGRMVDQDSTVTIKVSTGPA